MKKSKKTKKKKKKRETRSQRGLRKFLELTKGVESHILADTRDNRGTTVFEVRPKHGGARPGSGRPSHFSTPAISRTLHLPIAFWEALDNFGPDGSPSSRPLALRTALSDRAMLARLRRTLE